ncbi:MAG: translocation/assembly module TamB domain-containing protein [Deltaproteobacteria bacterium]
MRRGFYLGFKLVVLGAALLLAAAAFFVFTPAGARFLARRAMAAVSAPQDYDVKAVTGTLFSVLTLCEAEVRGPSFLPAGYAVRIQKANIYFDALSPQGLNVELYNGRLLLPGGAAVVADGIYQDGVVDAQIYGRHVEVSDLLGLLPADGRGTFPLKGSVASFDAQATGPLAALRVAGDLLADKISVERIAIEELRLRYDGTVFVSSDRPWEGEILIESGRLILPRSAVRLTDGRIVFRKDEAEPRLDIKGEAVVDRVPIRVFLTGTPSVPDLRFSSDDPALTQVQMTAMLLAGRSLGRDQEEAARGQVPVNLAKDVLDYLVFGGKITEFIARLGLKDVSLTVEGNKQGVGVAKEVAPDLEVRYGVSQQQGAADGTRTTSQSTGVSYGVTPNVSVEATTTANRTQTALNATAVQTDNTFLLKYRKSF